MFPSPYGVSFILIKNEWLIYGVYCNVSFRLLTEYHSFLFNETYILKGIEFEYEFPSPYGVSFILISTSTSSVSSTSSSFRLLTEYHSFLFRAGKAQCYILTYKVSVSLRSIIHSYFSLTTGKHRNMFINVSVSLRSIIHSYFK